MKSLYALANSNIFRASLNTLDRQTQRAEWLTPLHAHGVTRKETDGVQIVLSCEQTFQCHIILMQ